MSCHSVMPELLPLHLTSLRHHVSLYSLTHSFFIQRIWCTYCVPGAGLGPGDEQNRQTPCPPGVSIPKAGGKDQTGRRAGAFAPAFAFGYMQIKVLICIRMLICIIIIICTSGPWAFYGHILVLFHSRG